MPHRPKPTAARTNKCGCQFSESSCTAVIMCVLKTARQPKVALEPTKALCQLNCRECSTRQCHVMPLCFDSDTFLAADIKWTPHLSCLSAIDFQMLMATFNSPFIHECIYVVNKLQLLLHWLSHFRNSKVFLSILRLWPHECNGYQTYLIFQTYRNEV
jgi:hypothetical protein